MERILLLILLPLLVACAGACSSAPDTAALPPPTAPRPTQPPTAAATSTPTLPASPTATATPQPDTLMLWTTEQGRALELVRALAQEFGQQAGVSVQVVPRSTDTLRLDLIEAALVDEPLPDLIWGNQDDLAELLIDDQLQPIDQHEETEPFIPALITGATYKDALWGLPLTADESLLLLYNRALVAAPPATTDELISTARSFEDTQSYGIVAAWTEARWLLALLNGTGGTPTTSDGLQPTLNTPQMVAALNLLKELHMDSPPDQQNYTESRVLFGTGQVAFAIDGDWALPSYQSDDLSFDLGIAPLPRVPATGRRAAPAVGGTYIMVQRETTGSALLQARDFASYLTTADVQLRLVRTLQRLPSLRATLAMPAIANDPLLSAAAAQAEEAIGLPPTRALRCALWAMNIHLPAALKSDAEQQKAAEAMQQEAEWCLAQ